jgi:hypothetical protein
MGTFTDRDIVQEIIDLNGEPDPADWPLKIRAVKIVEYTGRGGNRIWGVIYRDDDRIIEDEMRYERETQYVNDPVVIWKLTE